MPKSPGQDESLSLDEAADANSNGGPTDDIPVMSISQGTPEQQLPVSLMDLHDGTMATVHFSDPEKGVVQSGSEPVLEDVVISRDRCVIA